MSEEQLRAERVKRAHELRARGVEPWKVKFDRTHLASQLHAMHDALPAGESAAGTVRVAGRLLSMREQGRIAFGDLHDPSGKIQLFVTGEAVAAFRDVDEGDIVGVQGEVVRTRRGELSVRPEKIELLAKTIRPLPSKWHGLKDVEVRFRQRYLDLIANPRAREIARTRTRAQRAFRDFLDERGFLEVETPTFHPIPGGGHARPFTTHYHALDADMYLRIACELYLKRLVVGGLERVYEFARSFRNEGISYKHMPEFTMLEAYQAYADYYDMMELTEAMLRHAAQEATGSIELTWEGRPVSLVGPWRRVSVLDAVSEAVGETVTLDDPIENLRDICGRRGIEVQPWWGPGMIIEELRDRLVEPSIHEPTILYDYPLEVSPLARTHRDDERLTERFEVICAGRELANAFSELNDPLEQRRRFELQAEHREHGDEEAQPLDEAFITALEYGMPPTGGLGIGFDRLCMLLCDVHTIREVILFPTLRPERTGDPDGADLDAGADADGD